MNYAVWIAEHDTPDFVWLADEPTVIADIRSGLSITEDEARELLIKATQDDPLKLNSKGYDAWVEFEKQE